MIFRVDSRCPIKHAANNMVNNGFVNINVMASPTGINLTQANVVSMVNPPKTPTIITITLSLLVLGQIFLSIKIECGEFKKTFRV